MCGKCEGGVWSPLEKLGELIQKQESLAIESREVLDHLKEWKAKEARDNSIKPWSALYSQCIICGTNGTSKYQIHASKGRCVRCYARDKAEEYRRAKGIQPIKKKIVSIPIPEPVEKVSEDWDRKAIPVECYECGMLFDPQEKRVETEDNAGYRIDWHEDCYQFMLNHK